MSKYKLGIIGIGAMAEAIVRGVVKTNLFNQQEIIASGRRDERLNYITNQLGISTTKDNKEIFNNSEIVMICVKPQNLEEAIKEVNLEKKNILIISIIVGITTTRLEDLLGKNPIIRVMPNTPALIGEGMTALCKNKYAHEEHIEVAQNIFEQIGKTIITEENMIDAVTGLSGSGPAYVYQFIEALADGGVLVGLPRQVAYELAVQTIIGSAKMVRETGMHPGELKDKVTSPKGTTIEGIRVLEKNAFRATVIEAVEASYLKAKNIGS
ncbi:pyrroline-5-carboxylate reductase [Desulfonispora thiosulfatigenes DSM 11270]|uniref:Pyrroline-5-carboxylate reductase n=1 Tax=Desulfonispora thiosulfatigenes DSM 11270 TaxID=656914 RepID=A0A1W1VLM3_DESTI|nr:pyrroline-5-carboxylate reductase [Desulfonispora thiosulfatigenes]SMB94228.1 pyrroline-5-carboxylate reductase [Desulfonispora thiosulfatigenes DSM 11270]